VERSGPLKTERRHNISCAPRRRPRGGGGGGGGGDLAGHVGGQLLYGHRLPRLHDVVGGSEGILAGGRRDGHLLTGGVVVVGRRVVAAAGGSGTPGLRDPVRVLVQDADAAVLSDPVGHLQRVHPQGEFTGED